MPLNAAFNPATRLFSWTPDYTQAGIYTVVFYTQDNDPQDPKTSRMEVVISVGEVTPTDLTETIVNTVTVLHLAKEVTNAYMANLKKVRIFIQSNKVAPAISQLNAFIGKVQQDITTGKMGASDRNNLINMAQDIIRMLSS